MRRSRKPLRLAVVGHTNTGKTSLLQTLLRRRDFGEVSASGGTTRAVEAGEVVDDEGTIAVLLDTPGFEESDRLRDAIESARTDRYDDPRTLLDRFLASPAASDEDDLGLEAASVRAALDADVLLYAIDARGDSKPRHLDELAVLAATARPLVPVLNYAARPEAHAARWRSACARQGLHATVAFDAVVYDDTGERRLLAAVKALAPGHEAAVDRWTALRARERREAIVAATDVAAELLVTAAAAVVVTNPKERDKAGRRGGRRGGDRAAPRRPAPTRDRHPRPDRGDARLLRGRGAGGDLRRRRGPRGCGLPEPRQPGAGRPLGGRRRGGPRGGRGDGRHRHGRRVAGRIRGSRRGGHGARRGRGQRPEGAAAVPWTGRGTARGPRGRAARRSRGRHHPRHARPRPRGPSRRSRSSRP